MTVPADTAGPDDGHTAGSRSDGRPGSEPDYRMSLAAERTYLAYVRTALALLAGGVAAVGAFPDLGQSGLRRTMGVLLVVSGGVLAGTARRRWRQVDTAMRLGQPLPASRMGLPLSAAMVTVGVLALIVVLTT
jgi:inner membrane protein YidH